MKGHYSSVRWLQNTVFVLSVIDFFMVQTLSDSTTRRFIPSIAQAFWSMAKHYDSIRNRRNTSILEAHMRRTDGDHPVRGLPDYSLDGVGYWQLTHFPARITLHAVSGAVDKWGRPQSIVLLSFIIAWHLPSWPAQKILVHRHILKHISSMMGIWRRELTLKKIGRGRFGCASFLL